MSAAPKSRPIGADFAWADGVAGRAILNAAGLREADLDFAATLAEALDRYGARAFLSGKQLDWLRDIEARLEAIE